MKCKIYFHLKRGLWTTEHQSGSFFSLAQIRCFWRCFCFRRGLVAFFLKMSERGDSWCTDSSFSSLLVKLSQVFESALLDSILKLAIIPCCLCTFSYPISSFQSTLHLICFATALFEQPPLSVMTLCDLPSLWTFSPYSICFRYTCIWHFNCIFMNIIIYSCMIIIYENSWSHCGFEHILWVEHAPSCQSLHQGGARQQDAR